MKCTEEALNGTSDKIVKTSLLMSLLDYVLKQIIFEFKGDLFIQKLGTAIWTRIATTNANIYIVMVDNLVKEYARTNGFDWIHFYMRFINYI